MYTRQKSAVIPEQIFVIVMTERNETLTRSGEICLGLIPIQPEVSYPATKPSHRKHIKTTLWTHHKLSANKIDDPTKIEKSVFLTMWAESVRHYIPAHLQGQRRRCNLEEEHLAPQFLESHSKDPVQKSRKKAYQDLSWYQCRADSHSHTMVWSKTNTTTRRKNRKNNCRRL